MIILGAALAIIVALSVIISPPRAAVAQTTGETPAAGAQTTGEAPAAEAQAEGGGPGSPFSTTDLTPEPPPAPPAAPPAPAPRAVPTLGGAVPSVDLLKALGAFIVVIVLLVIFLKLLAYFSQGRKMAKGGRAFTLKGTMIIDSRRYLAAVEIDGHFLVVGVTPDRLTALAEWPLDDGDGKLVPGAFKTEDAVEGPKALAPQARRPRPAGPAPGPRAERSHVPPVGYENPSLRPQKAPEAPAKAPGRAPLGPGRGAGLGADPRGPSGDGPVLDLSLDDAVFDERGANDDFLKMFEDENEPK
jgi:flagellar biogenesis protein FliO